MKELKRLSVQVTVDKSRYLEIKEKNLIFIRANSNTELLMEPYLLGASTDPTLRLLCVLPLIPRRGLYQVAHAGSPPPFLRF